MTNEDPQPHTATDFAVIVEYHQGIMTLMVNEGDILGTPIRIDGCELFCRADPAGFRVQVGREIVKPKTETAEDAHKMTHTDLGAGRYL